MLLIYWKICPFKSCSQSLVQSLNCTMLTCRQLNSIQRTLQMNLVWFPMFREKRFRHSSVKMNWWLSCVQHKATHNLDTSLKSQSFLRAQFSLGEHILFLVYLIYSFEDQIWNHLKRNRFTFVDHQSISAPWLQIYEILHSFGSLLFLEMEFVVWIAAYSINE